MTKIRGSITNATSARVRLDVARGMFDVPRQRLQPGFSMRNVHEWWERTPEGEKREVRATRFSGKWRIQSKTGGRGGIWVYHDPFPEMADLRALRDLIWRKYQRKRASHDDVVGVDDLIVRRQEAEDAGKIPRSPDPGPIPDVNRPPGGEDEDDDDNN